MNKTTVFIITGLGKALLNNPQGRITGDARLLMGVIDGSASIGDIAAKVPPSVRVHLDEIFTRLLTYGVIEEKGSAGFGAVLKKPGQVAKETIQQNMPAGQKRNEDGLALNDAEIENKRRIELEKELLEVCSKLEATIARQKKVEEDYLKLTQQVSAYAQGGQAKSGKKTQEPPPHAGNDLRGSLDSINQLNQALLDQQEILGNTLKLRAYQARLNADRLHKEHEAGDTKMAHLHPHYKSLRGLEFFRGFSNAELLDFLTVAKWQEVEAGATILSEGDIGMSFYVVVSGTVNIFRKGNMLAPLTRGDFFGEFAYLSGKEPVRSAHAVAATACELLAVDPLDIEFSSVQLRLHVVEALLRGQVRRTLLSDQRVDSLSSHLENTRHEPR
ncbi:MAG: cyclic nucleotide-binding domain-containing protein [Gallionella sp.]|nr:cyclic nucleotide-binding domain-containing protein [Gallionella sp.]